MPVPLTARHRLELLEGACSKCGLAGVPVLRAEIHMGLARDRTEDVCLNCLIASPVEDLLVFQEPDLGAGVRAPTSTMKKTSRRREGKLAVAIGGRQQPASGALPHAKGDVRRIGEWVGDDKTCRTTNKGYRLTREFITKIRSWCKRQEKFFITIGFLHPITQRVEDEVVVIDRHVFEELFANADDHR